MSLDRLFSNGSGGIAEWREMWNNEVLPYLHSERLVAGPGVRIDRHPAGTLIRVVSSDGGNGGGGLQLAVVTISPAGGFGVCECTPVKIATDGTYQVTSGAAISTITPYI